MQLIRPVCPKPCRRLPTSRFSRARACFAAGFLPLHPHPHPWAAGSTPLSHSNANSCGRPPADPPVPEIAEYGRGAVAFSTRAILTSPPLHLDVPNLTRRTLVCFHSCWFFCLIFDTFAAHRHCRCRYRSPLPPPSTLSPTGTRTGTTGPLPFPPSTVSQTRLPAPAISPFNPPPRRPRGKNTEQTASPNIARASVAASTHACLRDPRRQTTLFTCLALRIAVFSRPSPAGSVVRPSTTRHWANLSLSLCRQISPSRRLSWRP